MGVGRRWMWRPPGSATAPKRPATTIASGVSTVARAPASTKGPKAGSRLPARCWRKALLKKASKKRAPAAIGGLAELVGKREAAGQVERPLPDPVQVGAVLQPLDQVGDALGDL